MCVLAYTTIQDRQKILVKQVQATTPLTYPTDIQLADRHKTDRRGVQVLQVVLSMKIDLYLHYEPDKTREQGFSCIALSAYETHS